MSLRRQLQVGVKVNLTPKRGCFTPSLWGGSSEKPTCGRCRPWKPGGVESVVPVSTSCFSSARVGLEAAASSPRLLDGASRAPPPRPG